MPHPRRAGRVAILALAALFPVTIPAPASADGPPPPFESAPCLQSQIATQWRADPNPEAHSDTVDRNGDDGNANLKFTAASNEIKVAAPGVLGNDTMQPFGGDAIPVTKWNDDHGVTAQITAELARPPDHAAFFNLNIDAAKATGKGVVNGVGNHSFVLTATDLGTASSTPAAPDTFGLQVTGPNGATIPSLTFTVRPIATGGNVNIR